MMGIPASSTLMSLLSMVTLWSGLPSRSNHGRRNKKRKRFGVGCSSRSSHLSSGQPQSAQRGFLFEGVETDRQRERWGDRLRCKTEMEMNENVNTSGDLHSGDSVISV